MSRTDKPGDDARSRKRARKRQASEAAAVPGERPLHPHDCDPGLRLLLLDGVSTQVMGALTGGALLIGFALLLGASNKVIGLIAAVGPLTQLLQIPAILLIEKTRQRKALVIISSLIGRSFWVVVAAIPFIVPAAYRIQVLMLSLLLYFGTSAIANSAYNSWKRDLVPDAVMGRYFAKRLTLATAAGAAATLAAGFAIDHGRTLVTDPLVVFSPFFLLGALTGLLGVGFLGRIPEPPMATGRDRSLKRILTEPMRDENFRRLVTFLALWNFAVNLAAPFFAVYMLLRLELSLAWVLGLSVVSQVANVSFFRIWGRLADAFSNKSVLSFSGSLFILSIAIWPFTTLPGRYALTLPLLFVIHILAGISTAGVNLCAGSITLKLAPRGRATAFLATNALSSGLAATVAPALAGLIADAVTDQRLSLEFHWTSGEAPGTLMTALDLAGLDFLFVIAVVFGIYSLHRLLVVREEGEIDKAVAGELYREMRRAVRHVSNVAGLRKLTAFPFGILTQERRESDDENGHPPPSSPPSS
jgi:MFS family permease